MNKNSNRIVVATLVVAVVTLSCGTPQYATDGVKLEEGEEQIFSNIEGTYESTGELDDVSSLGDIENECKPSISSYTGKKETLTFEGNHLTIADENGERTYTRQYFGDFCRELENGNVECIGQITLDGEISTGYRVNVYDNRNNLKLCFVGYVGHNLVDRPPDSPDFDASSCWPQPSDYKLEIINLLVGASGNEQNVCDAEGTITNISDQDLLVAAYWVKHIGGTTPSDNQKWMTYRVIEPGETYEYGSFHRCSGGYCLDGNWDYIQRLSIIYSPDECSMYSDSLEDKAPESIVEITNPCD